MEEKHLGDLKSVNRAEITQKYGEVFGG